MNEALSWDVVRSFLAVHRLGSLSAAARDLALTQPTVGRHIDAMERALGVALFSRSVSGLIPTPAAEALVPHALDMAAAAATLLRQAHGAAHAEAGTVRIAASEVMSVEVLPPILARLQERRPGIVVELVASNRMENLLRRDADIAVRMARPAQEALTARRIGDVGLGLYAHRRYLAAHGAPATLDDLRSHRFIGFDRDDLSARAATQGRFALSRTDFTLRSDNDLVQLAAIRAGAGVGGMQDALAAADPDMVAVLAGEVRFTLELWLATHANLRASAALRIVFDALAEGLSAHVARGKTPPPA